MYTQRKWDVNVLMFVRKCGEIDGPVVEGYQVCGSVVLHCVARTNGICIGSQLIMKPMTGQDDDN